MIRPLVPLCDVHARCFLLRSDGPYPQSFHAELLNTDLFFDWWLQEVAQQIRLPFAGVQT